MSSERAYEIFYDSAANPRFRDALIDGIVTPAYARGIDRNKAEKITNGPTMFSMEEMIEGKRTTYDFFAQVGDEDIISVRSTTYTELTDRLSDVAKDIILREMEQSDITSDEAGHVDEFGNLKDDVLIETYVCRSFFIGLATGDVEAVTSIGYAVNEIDIDPSYSDDECSSELDIERRNIFEPDGIVEMVRALYALGLVTQEDVRKFLERDF